MHPKYELSFLDTQELRQLQMIECSLTEIVDLKSEYATQEGAPKVRSTRGTEELRRLVPGGIS